MASRFFFRKFIYTFPLRKILNVIFENYAYFSESTSIKIYSIMHGYLSIASNSLLSAHSYNGGTCTNTCKKLICLPYSVFARIILNIFMLSKDASRKQDKTGKEKEQDLVALSLDFSSWFPQLWCWPRRGDAAFYHSLFLSCCWVCIILFHF